MCEVEFRYKRDIHLLLPVSLALILSLFPVLFSNRTANNDVYLQLLSVEGLTHGAGYGFWQDGKFISMTSRPAHTRWPPGLTVIALCISLIGLDPLVALVNIYPFLIFGSYFVLFLALRRAFDLYASSIIAFASLTPLCVFNWYRELHSEPFAFFMSILLFYLVMSGQRTKHIDLLKLVMVILVSVILTMFRTTGVYFLPPAFLLYSLFWLEGYMNHAKFIVGGGLVAALPILMFHILSGTGLTPPAHTEKISFINELNGNIRTCAEVVMPRLIRLWRYGPLATALGWCVIVTTLLYVKLLWRLLRKQTGIRNDGLSRSFLVGLGFGISYIFALSISAVLYHYPWSSVYRVSGFCLPYMIIAFSSLAFILTSRNRWSRNIVILVILLTSIARYGYGWYYELLNEPNFKDYRQVVDCIMNVIDRNYKNVNQVYIYIGGHWCGRNLLYMFWYSQRYYKIFPWKIVPIKQFKKINVYGNNFVIIICKEDEGKFKNEFIKILSQQQYKKLQIFKFVLFSFSK